MGRLEQHSWRNGPLKPSRIEGKGRLVRARVTDAERDGELLTSRNTVSGVIDLASQSWRRRDERCFWTAWTEDSLHPRAPGPSCRLGASGDAPGKERDCRVVSLGWVPFAEAPSSFLMNTWEILSHVAQSRDLPACDIVDGFGPGQVAKVEESWGDERVGFRVSRTQPTTFQFVQVRAVQLGRVGTCSTK